MKLIGLTLTNFKKHKNLEISFGDQLTVIRGPNWAGKSSILHGILFALYGVHAVPGRKERLVTRGANKMAVSLTVEVNGEVFTLSRTLTTATVYDASGAIVAASGTAVEQWIELDRKLALSLAYSAQSETAALLTLGVPTLNKMVEQVSGADQIQEIIDRAANKLVKLQDKLSTFNYDEDRIETLNSEIKDLDKQLSEAELSKSKVIKALTDLRAEISEQQELLNKAYDLNDLIHKAKVNYDYAKKLESQINDLPEIPDLDSLKAEISKLKDKIEEEERLETNYRKLLRKYEKSQDELESINQWLSTNDWESTAKEKFEAVEQLEETVTQKRKEQNTLENKVSESNRLLATLKQALESSICPACDRPYDDAQCDQAKVEKQIEELQEEIKVCRKNLDTICNEITSTSKLLTKARAACPPSDWKEVVITKRLNKEELEKAIKPDKFVADKSLNEKLGTLNYELREHQKILTQKAKLTLELENALEASKGHDKTPPDIESIREEINHLTAKKQAQEDISSDLTSKISGLNATKKANETELAIQFKNKQSYCDLEKTKARFASFRTWLVKNKSAMLNDLWEAILDNASAFIREATQGYATALLRSEDGEFHVIEDGEESPASSISGGMKAIAATGLKLALAELLPNAPEFIVLDEPSSELNDENAGNFAGALKLSDRQVILVTHRVGEEYTADEVITLE